MKYGTLEKAYNLITDAAFTFFKEGDEKAYDFLQAFKVLFPTIHANTIPEQRLFREPLNSTNEEELEKLKKGFAQLLLQNPASSVFCIWSLYKLTGS